MGLHRLGQPTAYHEVRLKAHNVAVEVGGITGHDCDLWPKGLERDRQRLAV
jgi:hypothetical protein